MHHLRDGLIALGINLIAIIILFKIIDILDNKIRQKIISTENDSQLLRFMPVISKFVKALILFIALTGLFQSQGYSMTSILTGFGIGGIAVGMAAKDALANIFGSLEILSDRIYRIGDYVKINDVEGYVEEINIRSTKIRNLDNFLINLPNNIVANAVVINVSKAKKRFINETFGITYSTHADKISEAKKILSDIATEHKHIYNNFTTEVKTLGDSSINIRFRGYVKSGAYDMFLKVRSEFNEEVIKRFRNANIDFAFPSQSVYIEKEAK